jgi:Flp pilus assembly protein TadG
MWIKAPKGQRQMGRLAGLCRRFAGNDRGSVTVEFVMWVPVFCALLMLFADTSLTYMNQSNFWNVGRETARIVARHGLDADAAVSFAESHARFGRYTPKAEVTIEDGTVTVIITADAKAMSLFGVLNFAQNQTIEARVTDVLEPI